MRLRLEKISTSPSGLVLGVQVIGPKEAWIRFALLQVPWADVPLFAIEEYWAWADRLEREIDRDSPLPLDWG